jgi:hypothetical protein
MYKGLPLCCSTPRYLEGKLNEHVSPLHIQAKIAKDAKEITQECVSEFISFVTSE